jgi:hypothetical protein
MRASPLLSVLAGLALAAGPVVAAELTPVRPLVGYSCMMLNLTAEQTADPSTGVPVLNDPSPGSKVDGYAAAVIITNPFRTSGGYVETLWPTGKIGWIKAAALRPWRNRFVPSSTCTPALMSNGRYGFDFK